MRATHDQYLNALRNLSDNFHFKVFMKRVEALRDETMREATSLDNMGSDRKSAALLGSIRVYQDILDEYTSYAVEPID